MPRQATPSTPTTQARLRFCLSFHTPLNHPSVAVDRITLVVIPVINCAFVVVSSVINLRVMQRRTQHGLRHTTVPTSDEVPQFVSCHHLPAIEVAVHQLVPIQDDRAPDSLIVPKAVAIVHHLSKRAQSTEVTHTHDMVSLILIQMEIQGRITQNPVASEHIKSSATRPAYTMNAGCRLPSAPSSARRQFSRPRRRRPTEHSRPDFMITPTEINQCRTTATASSHPARQRWKK